MTRTHLARGELVILPDGETEIVEVDACCNCPAWSASSDCRVAHRSTSADEAFTDGPPEWCPLRVMARLLVLAEGK
jgi:hypothetical protein